jgi:hypothetical protein
MLPMKSRYWRDLVEIVAVLSVVGGLLLVAWEVRQANRIARAQTVMELAAQYNTFNSARFGNPEVARLALMLLEPDKFAITETEASMMSGVVYHFHNILWSAQVAYDNGLLSLEDLTKYRSDLIWMLTYMPGLIPELVNAYETQPSTQNVYVFEPLAELIAKLQVESANVD